MEYNEYEENYGGGYSPRIAREYGYGEGHIDVSHYNAPYSVSSGCVQGINHGIIQHGVSGMSRVYKYGHRNRI